MQNICGLRWASEFSYYQQERITKGRQPPHGNYLGCTFGGDADLTDLPRHDFNDDLGGNLFATGVDGEWNNGPVMDAWAIYAEEAFGI